MRVVMIRRNPSPPGGVTDSRSFEAGQSIRAPGVLGGRRRMRHGAYDGGGQDASGLLSARRAGAALQGAST